MRYLIKAVTEDVITITESNDLKFITAIFGKYYNDEIRYNKIEVVDNSTGEILAHYYEVNNKMDFYWALCDYHVPDIIF